MTHKRKKMVYTLAFVALILVIVACKMHAFGGGEGGESKPEVGAIAWIAGGLYKFVEVLCDVVADRLLLKGGE